jgi:hypothetical protein
MFANWLLRRRQPAPEIVRVEKVEVNEGDVLAVYVRGLLSAEARAMEKQRIEKAFLPKAIKVLILNADAVQVQVFKSNA